MADLEQMSLDDLRKLASAVANEVATRNRITGGEDEDSLMYLWHEALEAAVTGSQTLHVWKRGAGKHARKHLTEAERFTDRFFKKGEGVIAPQRYFARIIMTTALREYVSSLSITPTLSVMTKQLGNAADAVEYCYPGYARSGFLPMVFARFAKPA